MVDERLSSEALPRTELTCQCMSHPEDLERAFQRGRERSEQKSRRGKKGGTGGKARPPEGY